MPEERWEWLALVLGVLAAGVLVAAIVFRDSPQAAPGRAVAPVSTAVRRPTTVAATTTTAPAPSTTTRTAPPPAPVRLRLTARADTWVSVSSPSAGKRVLYQGTLPAGASRTFSGERFQVRFGAAANVRATLNGKPLPLPGGTYSVTVGESGLGPRSA